VKLVLPEGVTEPNSEFNALQERFEKILINRGLLNEGENMPPDEGSVTIPFVTAVHVLGETAVELAKGDMALTTVSRPKPDDSKSILVLTVATMAFPLYATTTFGTVANDELVYVFQPEIEDDTLPDGGQVQWYCRRTSSD
jgi:hypothetical protein